MVRDTLPVEISGQTVPFEGNGRKFGYPTANIFTQTYLTDGVYFGYASLGSYKNQPALIFVGTPVTLGESTRRLEAHLLDIVDKDYYDQKLMVTIDYFHRENHKFNSVKELLKAIHQDEAAGRRWFKEQST